MDIANFYREASGFEPYPYQSQLAETGLPELLEVPTGLGKTEAVVMAWLYRRFIHPDPAVRLATPRWLVYALPMRTLVEQTTGRIDQLLQRLQATDAGPGLPRHAHSIMGGDLPDGARWSDHSWRLHPEQPAIFVGTVDMLLSRALNRGYADGRFNWPISFGMFNNDCQWIFDETQLMGVAIPTSRQLQSFRERFGVVKPTHTTWMSATNDAGLLNTVDRPIDNTVICGLTRQDNTSALTQRLEANKTLVELTLPEKKRHEALASELVARHQANTLTIAIVNTVDAAVNLKKRLDKLAPAAEVCLLHSRYRPPDRADRTREILAPIPPEGRIVVATQVLEAGVDLSASLLYTDAAPWSSIVQRAGRCNRTGDIDNATILWSQPLKALPYTDDEVDAAIALLRSHEGRTLTPGAMSAIKADTTPPILPVLRSRDLHGLFDTSADLSGNDLDVSKFIRDTDSRSVSVVWRDITEPAGQGRPTQAEMCQVSISEFTKFNEKLSQGWMLNPLATGRQPEWVKVTKRDLRDGLTVLLPCKAGGYDPMLGWNKASTAPVEEISTASQPDTSDVTVEGDPHSGAGRWVGLGVHLADVEAAVTSLLGALGLDTAGAFAAAMARAGLLHDIGKAHPVFQDALRGTGEPPGDGPFAKSGNRNRLRYAQPYFRHELASLLAIMGDASHLVDDLAEPDLARYLVAAHHGRARLGIRRLPDEHVVDSPDTEVALGVVHNTVLPAVEMPDGSTCPRQHLDLITALHGNHHTLSYGERSLGLLTRPDIGPFRLAFMEAIVRLADWRASASYDIQPNGASS